MNYLTLVDAGVYQLRINSVGQYYRYDTILESMLNITDVEAKNMMIIHLKKVEESQDIVARCNNVLYAQIDYNKESELSRGEDNDCVVRAMTAALEIPYDEAHKFVEEAYGRKRRKGTQGTSIKADKLDTVFGKRFVQMGEECPSEGWIKRSKQFSDRRFRYDGKRLIWSFKERVRKNMQSIQLENS